MKDLKTMIIGAIAIIALIMSMVGVGGNNQSTSTLWASGSRFPHGISADSTSPSSGQVRGTTLTATGAATIGSTLGVTGAFSSAAADVARFTQGGSRLATSSTAVAEGVLTEAQLISNVGIDLTLTGEATHTMTLPATSTLDIFIPNAGDSAILHYSVIGTAATASSTIAAGTGMDLVKNEATGADVIIEAGNDAWLRFIRQADTDVTVFVDEYIAAD